MSFRVALAMGFCFELRYALALTRHCKEYEEKTV